MTEELRRDVSLLEQEKREKAMDRLRYEREIEQLEESWKKESHELLATISRLQEDNRKLEASLKETAKELQQTASVTSSSKSPVSRGELDWDLFEKLREVNEKQREQLRSKDKDYQDKVAQVESLSSQVDRLSDSNRELRRKAVHAADQMRCLAEERADLQAALNDQARNLDVLNKRLGLAQRDNQDLIRSKSPDMTNKIVVDLNDPNRPRFTVAELKEILCERNEHKARVSDLTDELALYRPKNSIANRVAAPVPAPVVVEDRRPEEEEPAAAEEDLPVQGPMPYEPEDAPWRRSSHGGGGRKRDSNIRRLYVVVVWLIFFFFRFRFSFFCFLFGPHFFTLGWLGFIDHAL